MTPLAIFLERFTASPFHNAVLFCLYILVYITYDLPPILVVVGLVSGFVSGLKSLQQPETWQGLASTTSKYMEYMKDAVNTSLKDSFSETWAINDHDDDYYGSDADSPTGPGNSLGHAQSKSSLSEIGQGVITKSVVTLFTKLTLQQLVVMVDTCSSPGVCCTYLRLHGSHRL